MAMATASALSEGRASTVTTNNLEIFDCCRRLASHLNASIEMIERADGLTDLIFRPPPRSTSTTASPLPTRSAWRAEL
jgi:hypothetical protein